MAATRFSLLRILADGEIHPGERIGRTLGLSPVEVDNLAGELETLGPRVLRGGGSDYRLEERVDLYDANLLTALVEGDFPGLCLEVLDECLSTNTALAERAKAGAMHGTVLACEYQSAGRGRRGNVWVSSIGGSVTFSVLWRFSRGTGGLAGLSLAVAVGAAKALERLDVRNVAVKWPNDLFCGGRKLGGILIETAGDPVASSTAVVGVGINMRMGVSARQRIGQPVTDIASNCTLVPSRTVVLAGLLVSIASALEEFSRVGFAPFRRAWMERDAWQGKQVLLSHADRCIAAGEAVGIGEDGALELASERGIERFYNGELSLRLG
jgi:BirA family biotin operon repressor/biotin-[acetyl-CoA-carboxylase] ligase